MTTKSAPVNNNVNNNTNNNVNVNVHVKPPRKKAAQKKSTQNWYIKTILGGIITVIVALAIYYGKQNLNNHNKAIQNDLPPVIGTKQTKN